MSNWGCKNKKKENLCFFRIYGQFWYKQAHREKYLFEFKHILSLIYGQTNVCLI